MFVWIQRGPVRNGGRKGVMWWHVTLCENVGSPNSYRVSYFKRRGGCLQIFASSCLGGVLLRVPLEGVAVVRVSLWWCLFADAGEVSRRVSLKDVAPGVPVCGCCRRGVAEGVGGGCRCGGACSRMLERFCFSIWKR